MLEAGSEGELRMESKPDATLLGCALLAGRSGVLAVPLRGAALQEFAGYDCHGPAAYFGHYLIRDKYRSAESMDSLDLTTVSSIANETLKRIRESLDGCGGSTETLVMYANGRMTDVRNSCAQAQIKKPRRKAAAGQKSSAR